MVPFMTSILLSPRPKWPMLSFSEHYAIVPGWQKNNPWENPPYVSSK